jgi:hypothetical protein
VSKDAFPQIFAGGALGHDPFDTGGGVVDEVGSAVAVVAAVVVGAGAVVVVVDVGAVVVGAGSVVGAVVVGSVVGVVVVGSEAGAVVVGEVVGTVPPSLATVKSPRRLDVVPSAHVSTTRMVCDPLASFVVSYATAVPSAAVPAKSKGAARSVRTGGLPRELSR